MSVLFYCWYQEPPAGRRLNLDSEYCWSIWRPRWSQVRPLGAPWMPFAAWWIMHYLRLFTNRGYGLFVVYSGRNLVHRSTVSPRYFRFPFMEKDDLQIGDVWTDPNHRRRGLAAFAIQEIVAAHGRTGRRIWYLTEADNVASVKAIEKLGFVRVGEGARRSRFGVDVLGYFDLRHTSHA